MEPLTIEPEDMRALGYRVIDALVERLSNTPSERPLRTASRAEMEHRLREPPPATPRDLVSILDRLEADVLPFVGRWDHPRFFAYVPGSGTWPGALGDLIASALNIDGGTWRESAGPTELELVVLDWFKAWVSYPSDATGVLVSGGSAANMTALACAREALLGRMDDRAVVYFSDQTHSSMARAARILGFGPDQVRVLPVDEAFRMRPEALEKAITADRQAGRKPFFAAAAGGSTSTGSVDPFEDLASVCRDQGVWLHADAAYGGFATLTQRGKRYLAGMEFADSMTLDPHKWLYQPFECGCLLVREGNRLNDAFRIVPHYLKDTQGSLREVNFSDRGMQLTRSARALKLWISLNYFGVDAFRRAIDGSLDLARHAQKMIEDSSELQLVTPAWLSIVSFVRRTKGMADEDEIEALNAQLVHDLAESGEGLISSTRLKGRYVLRLCVLNHTTRQADVEAVLRWLEGATVAPKRERRLGGDHDTHRDRGVRLGWLGGRALAESGMDQVRLFRSLDESELTEVLASASERHAVAGDQIVGEGEMTKEFYVLLEGEVDFVVDGERRDHRGAGEFFGELAALDWGAEFSYPRLATVVASTDVRLLVLPTSIFNRLVKSSADVSEQVNEAVRRRLPGL